MEQQRIVRTVSEYAEPCYRTSTTYFLSVHTNKLREGQDVWLR
jgi:hypothetical protein